MVQHDNKASDRLHVPLGTEEKLAEEEKRAGGRLSVSRYSGTWRAFRGMSDHRIADIARNSRRLRESATNAQTERYLMERRDRLRRDIEHLRQEYEINSRLLAERRSR